MKRELVLPSESARGMMMMPVPLVGPNPTVKAPTVYLEAQMTRPMEFSRILFSKVGSGRLSGMLYIGHRLLSREAFDPELFGSPNGFGMQLNLPRADPGVIVRLHLMWIPGPWTCQMSPTEFARRKRSGNWRVSWEGNVLTIKPAQAKRRLVTAGRLAALSIPDWHDSVQINCALLGYILERPNEPHQ